MELNREQIIKALECCGTENKCCSSCPLAKDYSPCSKTMANNALAFIKELTEENERLRAENGKDKLWEKLLKAEGYKEYVDKAKAETVRKMQERLTTFFENDDYIKCVEVDAEYINEQINNVAKEMLEGV